MNKQKVEIKVQYTMIVDGEETPVREVHCVTETYIPPRGWEVAEDLLRYMVDMLKKDVVEQSGAYELLTKPRP